MDYPSQVRGWLEADVADIAARPEECALRPGADFTRNRKLPLAELVMALVAMGAGSIRHELMERFSYDPARVPTPSAFCQQRAKLRPEAMRRLLRAFASRLGLSEWRGGWALVAVDGTGFSFGPDPSDASTFVEAGGGRRAHNEVHAVALQDMVGGHYLDAAVLPLREKDEFRAMCDLVDGLPEWARGPLRAIFVADRGFASYNVYAHVIEAGMHFAIRAKDQAVGRMLGLGGGAALPDELDRRVRLVLARTRAASKVAQPGRIGDYRAVGAAFDYLGGERPEYGIELRVVRFPIGGGKFENIVTNLPEGEFGPDDLREIYGMRWSIETSFRALKLNVGAERLHSRTSRMVEQELFARMVLYDFCAAVAARVDVPQGGGRGRKHRRRANFADACRACCAFLRGRARGPDVEKLVAGSTSPVRPGRSFDRKKRKRTSSNYAYRPA